MAEQPELTGRIFSRISELFEEGILHPLPYTVFDVAEIAGAFRYMQHSRQIGKVVVRQEVGSILDSISDIPSRSAMIHSDATYLITGGTSGFGLQSAGWLVDRGARTLVLMSRRGNLDEAGKKAVESMEAKGASVTVMASDVSVREDLEKSLASIREWMPPLKGVIHSAMVIDDGLLRQLSERQLDRVMRPKVVGALLLDEMTREDDLDLFVLYSSATTYFGNPGQGAYVAANCVLESISTLRRLEGLPSTCVSWGPIGDAGYLARNEKIKDALCSRMGGLPLNSVEALQTLGALANIGQGNVAWIDLEWGKIKNFLPSSSASLFSMLRHLGDEESGSGHLGGNLREELMSLPQEELHDAVTTHLKHEISKILRIEEAMIDESKSLFDMGMDSLMGVELVGALELGMGIHLPILALSEGPTISKLSKKIVSLLHSDNAESIEPAENSTESEEQVMLLAAQHGVLEIRKEQVQEIVLSSSAGASK
jgi:NAD(P)-dependent dehydrogenase (short-subunit alcohol dehydrogenase family)/acyl carrier protein